MIDYRTFDAWQSVMGYVTVFVYLFVYPFVNSKTGWLKVLFWIGVVVHLFLPYFVHTTPDEEDDLLLRSGKILHTVTLVLFFYCFVNRNILQKVTPYFFWFCYALAIASLFELFLMDVLFNSDYYFLKPVSTYLNKKWGIQDFNFTAPINYSIKFIFIGLFFRDAMILPIWKKACQYAVRFLIIFELLQVVIFKSYQGYDSLSSTVKNIFIVATTCLLLYRIYNHPSISLSLTKNTYFWICIGLLLPTLAESFLEFIFSTLYQTDESQFYALYLLRNTSQFIGFVLLIIGVWQARYLKFLPNAY